jgi:hypothetical protein
MTHSSDEFGDSLEDLFPNLASDSNDMPDLEQVGDFASGSGFRQTPPAYTDTHLCAMFIDYHCRACGSHTLAPQNYAIRRISNGRNQCIDYQAIAFDRLGFFDHLPRYKYHYQHHSDFCQECLSSDFFREEMSS